MGAKAGDKKTGTSDDQPRCADRRSAGRRRSTCEFEVLEVKRAGAARAGRGRSLSDLGDFDNEGELRDCSQGELERRLDYQQQRRIRQQITALLTESADWELPPDLLKRQAAARTGSGDPGDAFVRVSATRKSRLTRTNCGRTAWRRPRPPCRNTSSWSGSPRTKRSTPSRKITTRRSR